MDLKDLKRFVGGSPAEKRWRKDKFSKQQIFQRGSSFRCVEREGRGGQLGPEPGPTRAKLTLGFILFTVGAAEGF